MSQELHVIFGTGPIGLAVMESLRKRGKTIRMVNRRGVAQVPAGVELRAADASDPAQARQVSAGATHLYNCTNPSYTAWVEQFPPLHSAILEAAAAAGAKLIVMENLYMYGHSHGKPITEQAPYTAQTRKGIVRTQMTEALFAAHRAGKVRATSGRAADFFGAGGRDSAAGETLFGRLAAGKSVQMIGNPDLPHTYSYIPDIGEALAILGEEEAALGLPWHIPSPRTVTTREFVRLAAEAMGQPAKIQTMPKLLLAGMALVNPMMRELKEMAYEFEEPFVMDHSAFAAAFGDHHTPLEQALRATAAWYQAQNP